MAGTTMCLASSAGAGPCRPVRGRCGVPLPACCTAGWLARSWGALGKRCSRRFFRFSPPACGRLAACKPLAGIPALHVQASRGERLVVGLTGYPNVGKSSTINALFGSKKTAVAPTPGKTKHFQVGGPAGAAHAASACAARRPCWTSPLCMHAQPPAPRP